MNHTTTVNGIVTYELEPITDVDRYVIEIMKTKGRVTVKQSKKGGIIFELEDIAGATQAPIVTDDATVPVNLNDIPRKNKPE